MLLLKENKSRTSYYLFKFKTAVHTVMAAMRFQYVVRRKQQYLHTYSAKIERQKSSTSNAATGASGFPVSNLAPATIIHGTIKPVSNLPAIPYSPSHPHSPIYLHPPLVQGDRAPLQPGPTLIRSMVRQQAQPQPRESLNWVLHT